MHKSLTPKANLLLISVWASVVLALSFSGSRPIFTIIIGVGLGLGTIIGFLQLQAIEKEKESFLAATTAQAVRAAIMKSAFGRFSIYLLWISGGVLISLAAVLKGNILFDVLGGYAALMLARDLVTLKGCYGLVHSLKQKES